MKKKIVSIALAIALLFGVCNFVSVSVSAQYTTNIAAFSYNGYKIPAYDGDAWENVNGSDPNFTKSEKTTTPFEKYSSLDSLGRCGVAYANVCEETMPTSERGSISSVTPTGWHSVKYDCVSGKYLYNRCHLIGWQLTGENANKKNLITGTRSLNIDGMLPFENKVADYVENTDHHVLYRVTPIFMGKNLLATGVLIEAESVEDNKISICVFCYNVQDGIALDYATGASTLKDEVRAIPISKCQIALNKKKFVYTGKHIKPKVTVKHGSNSLVLGSDYTLAFSKNKSCGTASVKITGKSPAYSSSKTIKFYILPKKVTFTKITKTKNSITLNFKKQSGANGYQIAYRKMGPNSYKYVTTSTNKKTLTRLSSGKYHQLKVRAYVVIGGKRNYGEWSAVKKIKTK